MATTPPPPRRLHTPPTPLHGPRYDTYEPYSPRRSSRVAAQRKSYSQQLHSTDAETHHSPRVSRAITPDTNSRKQPSSQTFSPPSSPPSPITRPTIKSPRSAGRVSNGLKHRLQAEAVGADSDSDHLPTSSRASRAQHLSAMDPRGMLPTPAKTPRKKNVHADLSSTARVLFPNRLATVEDAMPTPTKGRKAAKRTAFTLQSFMEGDEEVETEKIEIYTDSKDRVPALDDDEDNPFITKKGKGKAPAPKRRKVDPKVAEAERAARNDEGMLYVFRGRKIFRKFDEHQPAAADDEELHLSEEEIRRRAGAEAHRPFTRSTIKPRLLFPNEEQRLVRLERDLEEEEASTDIEALAPSSSRKTKETHEIVTPIKQHFRPATPPSSGRARRGKKAAEEEVPPAPMDVDIEEAETSHAESHVEEEVATPPAPKTRGKKNSPFDSWARTKPGARSAGAKGVKRRGEPLEKTEGKRTRSAAHATPSSSAL